MYRYVALVVALSVLVGGPAATASGTYEYDSEWGGNGSGQGQFNYVTGVATDASGNVYCGDADNNRVQKFTAGGDFVVDEWNHRVQKFVLVGHDAVESISLGSLKAVSLSPSASGTAAFSKRHGRVQ